MRMTKHGQMKELFYDILGALAVIAIVATLCWQFALAI
jgi:hypothetical protein